MRELGSACCCQIGDLSLAAALGTAALMLGSDKSRVVLPGNPKVLLFSMLRLFRFLPELQKQEFLRDATQARDAELPEHRGFVSTSSDMSSYTNDRSTGSLALSGAWPPCWLRNRAWWTSRLAIDPTLCAALPQTDPWLMWSAVDVLPGRLGSLVEPPRVPGIQRQSLDQSGRCDNTISGGQVCDVEVILG